MSLLIEANRVLATGAADEAAGLRDAAFEAAPATAGTLIAARSRRQGEPVAFEWIADADPRLGPVLEAIFDGKYYWVPFDRISQIDIEPPADLRDQVWMPAHFTWTNGGETRRLHSDPLSRVGRPPTTDARAVAPHRMARDGRAGKRVEPAHAGHGRIGRGNRGVVSRPGAADAGHRCRRVPLTDLRRLEIAAAPAA